MIRLTNLADYAVVLSSHLASRPEMLHTAAELSAETGIPVPTVSKILGALSRGDVLTSQRGLKGGFRLARAAKDITVCDIVEAVDGPVALTNCVEGSAGDCAIEGTCVIKTCWQPINNAIRDGLNRVTLDEIVANGVMAATNGLAGQTMSTQLN
ncbi:MAG: SUF system Fe-S cluster assembly regulator [Sphingomonadales bacterium]|nr:SUF system Fe-S cluster assembly regulator [Sphingomonadales bacterium]